MLRCMTRLPASQRPAGTRGRLEEDRSQEEGDAAHDVSSQEHALKWRTSVAFGKLAISKEEASQPLSQLLFLSSLPARLLHPTPFLSTHDHHLQPWQATKNEGSKPLQWRGMGNWESARGRQI